MKYYQNFLRLFGKKILLMVGTLVFRFINDINSRYLIFREFCKFIKVYFSSFLRKFINISLIIFQIKNGDL